MKVIKHASFLPILVVIVFFLALLLRLYQLGAVPKGLYPDESAIGYNAYAILMTGRDEHGQSLPLYFRSFDDYKMPVYMYATALAIKVFGPTDFAVRITSALFGFLAVIALYLLVLILSRNKLFAAVAALFLAFNPWHVFFSRTGYEVNVATSLMVIGTLCFVSGVKKKNNFLLLILAAVAFLLSAYTYNVTRLLAPLYLFSLLGYYYYARKTSWQQVAIVLAVFFVGFLPLIVTFFTMQSLPGFSTHKDALIIGNEVKAELLGTRSYFTGLPQIVQKLFFNYWVLVAWTYVKNLVSFFSTGFFFVTGSDKPNQNLGGGLAMFYYFELPFIVYGIYHAIRRKITFLYPFLLWFLLVLLVSSSVKIVPNGTRAFPVVIPLVVFSSYGFTVLAEYVLKIKNTLLRYSIMVLSLLFISYSVIFYFLSYFYRMPVEFAVDWRSEDRKAVAYINSISDKYQHIVFDDSAEFVYTSLLYYSLYSPAAHQRDAVYKPSGLVISLAKTGKYEFRKVDWEKELSVPGTLFITGAKNVPQQTPRLAVITYPTRPVVLYYDRQISQFPTTDIAYVILESGHQGIQMK